MAEAKEKLKEKTKDRYFLNAKIEKFAHKMAVIVTNDGQKLLWPIKELPDDCQAGTLVRIILSTDQSDQAEREKIAKDILNQILKNKTDL